MSIIRWLHVSDLHINRTGVETENMRKKLLDKLKNLEIKFDYVFFTGDLYYAPSGYNCSEDVVAYLKEIIDVVHVPLERLFIVPGNHDIDRENTERLSAIKRVFDNGKGYYNPSEGIINSEDAVAFSYGKKYFLDIVNQLYGEDSEYALLYAKNTNPHFIIETDDFNIIHLDSSLLYHEHQQKDLVVGTYWLYDLLKNLNREKTSILLTHYSFDFLAREEQKQIIEIMLNHNIQIWIAGHEHDTLVRKQRECFYEFQAGSMVFESATTNCVLISELNSETGNGTMTAQYWVSPSGWAEYPYISLMGEDRSKYKFKITPFGTLKEEIRASVASIPVRDVDENTCAINLYDLDEKNLNSISEEGLEEIKNQMGSRLDGKENREDIIRLFSSEISMSLNSNKRFGCMPLFANVLRDKYDGYIYLDDDLAPIDKVRVLHFYFENYDRYVICGAGYNLEVVTCENMPIEVTYAYDLSSLTDVNDRLFMFRTIISIASAGSVHVKIKISETDLVYLNIDTKELEGDEWIKNREVTQLWIHQMEKIARIEQQYGIKFKLPPIAAYEDYCAVDILINSLERECCCTTPGLPLEKTIFGRRIIIPEEIDLGNILNLPPIKLFQHTFVPIKNYMIPCELIWNKHTRVWETKSGGVPTGVEFIVVSDEQK